MPASKPYLELADVKVILAAAEGHARANGWAVSIAVVDDGGHLLGFERLDECAPFSAQIAIDKARAAALGRRESRLFEDMINKGRFAFISAPLDGLLEGGVPVRVGGQVVGAVGVSGVQAAQDAQVAKAGAEALGSVA